MTSTIGTQTGAPDFLSAQQWSDDPLFTGTLSGATGGVPTSVFNCSQFANTVFGIGLVGSNVRVVVNYCSDAAGANQIATRQFFCNGVAGSGSAFALPNLANFFFLMIFTTGNVANAIQLTIQPTNRAGPSSQSFNPGGLIELTNQAVGAGLSVVTNVNTLYTGPCHLSGSVPFASGTIQLSWIDQAGAGHPVLTDSFVAAPGLYFRSPLFVPPAPLVLAVFNGTAGASSFSMYLVPDLWRLNS